MGSIREMLNYITLQISELFLFQWMGMLDENVLDQDGFCGIKERQWVQRRAERKNSFII
jgi:hypothetical protein